MKVYFEVTEDEKTGEIKLIDYIHMKEYSQQNALQMLMRTRIYVKYSEDGYKTELHKKIIDIEAELLMKKLTVFRRKKLNNIYNKLIDEFEKIPDYGRIEQTKKRNKWFMKNGYQFMVKEEDRE